MVGGGGGWTGLRKNGLYLVPVVAHHSKQGRTEDKQGFCQSSPPRISDNKLTSVKIAILSKERQKTVDKNAQIIVDNYVASFLDSFIYQAVDTQYKFSRKFKVLDLLSYIQR